MANHCIDVICVQCGYGGCARGCNNWGYRRGSRLDAVRARFTKPVVAVIEELKQRKKYGDDMCPHCNIPMVVE